MITWNQGNLFVVEVISFEKMDVSGGPSWELKIRFHNLAIEPSYFTQCLEKVYFGDRNIALDGHDVSFGKNVNLNGSQQMRVLIEEAWILVLEMAKHPKWGMVGGPNMAAEHEAL